VVGQRGVCSVGAPRVVAQVADVLKGRERVVSIDFWVSQIIVLGRRSGVQRDESRHRVDVRRAVVIQISCKITDCWLPWWQ
jgi:hypothetical protein